MHHGFKVFGWLALGEPRSVLLSPIKGQTNEKIAILGYFGSFAVHRQLVAIRQASEVTRHDKRPNISQQTEDGRLTPLKGRRRIMLKTISTEA